MGAPKVELLAIGNAIVDVIAETSDAFLHEEEIPKGSMQLIDAGRAKRLYGKISPKRQTSGGSAANTVAGLAMLGHKCAFMGQVANDELGGVFARDMRNSNVAFLTKALDQCPPTAQSLILVTPDGQRTMNTYLGASRMLTSVILDAQRIAEAGALYLEGYLWDSPMARNAMKQAIKIARSAGRRVILTLSDAWLVERHKSDFLELMSNRAIDILFANKEEALAMSRHKSFVEAVSELRSIVPLLVVTDGPNGAHCFLSDRECSVGADKTVKVVDTTGAGDAFAAGFLSGYLRGHSHQMSLEMGTICATEVISHFGPRPEADLRQLTRPITQTVSSRQNRYQGAAGAG